MPIDYEYGKIYKIVSPSRDLCYVGSTAQPLCNRIAKHRCGYKEEGKYIRKIERVNRCIAGRTSKQYREENKETINKKYNCSCGGKYTHSNKARHLKNLKHLEGIHGKIEYNDEMLIINKNFVIFPLS